jgi:Na+/alanine symporter
MRLEYAIELNELQTPRFAVEAVEGIGKLFTLATLVLNVLETRQSVEIVFHGLNPEDPERKITSFREIIATCASSPNVRFEPGARGRVTGSSSAFQWLVVSRD